MYWKPHVARVRMARARNIWKIRSTQRISASARSVGRAFANVTASTLLNLARGLST
jgi:hypothetical protein